MKDLARHLRRLGILSLLLLVTASCSAPFVAQPPASFAAFDEGDDFRSASHDGVLFRVRDEPNEPKAELPFWKEALKKRMDDAGYVLLGDSEIEASGKPGYLLKLAAPVGTADYAYWIAIFVHADNIIVAEATGPAATFGKHQDAVAEAITQITFR